MTVLVRGVVEAGTGVLEVGVVEVETGILEVGVVEVALDDGEVEVITVVPGGVVSAVAFWEVPDDLQAAGKEAIATPAAATAACFKNCRLEKVITRNVFLFRGFCLSLFSDIISP